MTRRTLESIPIRTRRRSLRQWLFFDRRWVRSACAAEFGALEGYEGGGRRLVPFDPFCRGVSYVARVCVSRDACGGARCGMQRVLARSTPHARHTRVHLLRAAGGGEFGREVEGAAEEGRLLRRLQRLGLGGRPREEQHHATA